MDKKELEEILKRHAKGTEDKLEKYTKNIGYKLEIIADDVAVTKEGMSHLRDDMSSLQKDVSNLQKDVSILQKDMSSLTEKVDVIFEQTGNLTVDMGIVKNAVQRHEQKIKQL